MSKRAGDAIFCCQLWYKKNHPLFESEILIRMTTSVVRAFLFAITNKNFTGHTAVTIPHAVMALTKGVEIQKRRKFV